MSKRKYFYRLFIIQKNYYVITIVKGVFESILSRYSGMFTLLLKSVVKMVFESIILRNVETVSRNECLLSLKSLQSHSSPDRELGGLRTSSRKRKPGK